MHQDEAPEHIAQAAGSRASIHDPRVWQPLGVKPEEIHIVRDHYTSSRGGEGEVLTISGAGQTGIRRGGDVDAPMAQRIGQHGGDVFV